MGGAAIKKVVIPKNAVAIRGGKGNLIQGYKIGNETYDAQMNPTNAAAKAAVAKAAKPATSSSGGGGGGGKGGPISAISDAVNSVGSAVTSAVTAVGNTVDAIIKNPLPIVETVALVAVGVPPPVAAAAVSAMNGGNVSDVATAAVTAYAGSQIASAVGGSAGSTIAAVTEPTAGAYIPSTTTSTLVKVASSAVGADVAATTIALSQGKDLTTALDAGTKAATSSVIASTASGVGSTVASKVDNAAAAQILANAAAGGTTAALTGKDIATGAATAGTLSAAEQGIKSALDTGADALKSITKPTPTSTAALPPGQVAALGGAVSPDTTSQSDVATTPSLKEIAPAPAPVTEPKQGAFLPSTAPTTADQKILDLIAEKPAAPGVAAIGEVPPTPDKTPVTAPPVEAPVTAPPVAVDANIPRVEVSGVGNIEPPQGAYLPDTLPAKTTAIEPAPVAEGYSTSMPDQSPAETARLAAKEQQILDLITPTPAATEPKQGAYLPDTAPVTTEPKQGAFLPETAPAPAEIPAADPMSKDPAQKAAEAIDTSTVPAADKKILDLIAETPDQSEAETARLAAKEAELAASEKGAYLPDSGTDTKTTTNTYKPTIFSVTDLSPRKKTAAAPASALGSALGTTGLTSYRGAGEIEGTGSGKPRKNVWNVESLKLKDALGV